MTRIAILASGSGSNAEAIIKYFKPIKDVEVSCIVTNNKGAGVLKRAESHHIPSHIVDSKRMAEGALLDVLHSYQIDWVVLAGFMKLIPKAVTQAFPDKVLNIHPALLPKFGGKGMYGMNVHKAVVDAGEEESGMTIHYVNEKYDEGRIIFQGRVKLEKGMTAEEVAARVLELEHKHYPEQIEQLINKGN